LTSTDAELRELVSRVSRAVAAKLANTGSPQATQTTGGAAAKNRAAVAEIVAAEVALALAGDTPRPAAPAAIAKSADVSSTLARAELCASCIEQERRKTARRAVVTTTGKNQKGIVAKIAQGIADAGGDILDISQTLVADYFTMIIVIDMSGLEIPFAEFKARITRTVGALGAECLVMHEEVVTALQRV
jgi:ACT domain-containing protein